MEGEELIAKLRTSRDSVHQNLVNSIECHSLETKAIEDLERYIKKYPQTEDEDLKELKLLTMALASAESRQEICQVHECRENEARDPTREEHPDLEVADLKELRSLQVRFTAYEEKCFSQEEQISKLTNLLESSRVEFDNLKGKYIIRHNKFMEQKGNIRVFCRVRPSLPGEENVVSYPTSSEFDGENIDLTLNGKKHSFKFDRVFSEKATQEDVYLEIADLIQSALNGYKVCIFAYGQIGSGKTFTMMGSSESPEQEGLIPRSIQHIFNSIDSLSVQGWSFEKQVSMLELYNDTIRDLLVNQSSDGNMLGRDITIVPVDSVKMVLSLLRQAEQRRSVGKTQMNEQSSRSHFVFTMQISGVNKSTGQEVQSVLKLVDLAGSARMDGVTSDRQKETMSINKSLFCLAGVINALGTKSEHVPFRESKLTLLLEECLGRDSKALMFVNISPASSSVGQTLHSLRLALKANNCRIVLEQ